MSQTDNPIQGQGTSAEQWRASRRLAALPVIADQALIPVGARVVVVAPHPDDEVLGCGGLLAQLLARDIPFSVVAVTDGEGSHPNSAAWPTEKLRSTRQAESQVALACLGEQARHVQWTYLHLVDSQVEKDESMLVERLQAALATATHVITTWRLDGHCDHEAVGRATAVAAAAQGAALLEVPIWAWHWADPEDVRLPWDRACKVPLDDATLARKQAAIRSHASQLTADPSTGAPPILTERTLARFAQPYEVYFR